ncbi:MAG: hypothetical protein WBZ36_08215 [Candidatus Nitrosopolaris sp.]
MDRDPSLGQIPMGRYGIVADGENLPSCIREDVRGFSLRPSYSAKQLRRIEHRAFQYNNKNLATRRFTKPSVGQIRRESDRYVNGDIE